MAAKSSVLIALLIAAVAVTSTSAYTTVVTTTMYREDCCSMEMEQMMPMQGCMQYMRSQSRDGEDAFLRSANADRLHKGSESELEQCCSELRSMSPECTCNAVKQMMSEMPQIEMRRMACNLPSMCGMSPCACPRSSHGLN